jgi:hypothetical protein
VPTYLTVAQLQAVLAAASADHTGTAASLPTADLEDRIEAAEQTVDAKLLVAGYDVPLLLIEGGGVPPLISELTAAVAAYFADLQYRRNKAHDSDDAPVLLRYRWAISVLAQIGTRLLVVPGVVQDPAKRGQGAEAVSAVESYDGRMFTPEIAEVGVSHPDWSY